jgi:hypothetical protein
MKQYRFVHPFMTVLICHSFLSIVAGLVVALFLSPVLGLSWVIAGLLFVYVSRRSTARRYIVDFDVFRVPRYPSISRYLLWNRDKLHWINVGCVGFWTVVCFVAFENLANRFIAIGVTSVLVGMMFIATVRALGKFTVDTLFRIVVFRRYSAAVAENHKAYILPACGCYGQVLLLTDDTLSAAWEGGWRRMNQWVLAELYQPLVANPNDSDWQEIV